MGKTANARAWAEFERIDRQRQEESFGTEPSLTEAERASEWDDEFWNNKDDDPATAVRRYALPVTRVRLFDEVEVGR